MEEAQKLKDNQEDGSSEGESDPRSASPGEAGSSSAAEKNGQASPGEQGLLPTNSVATLWFYTARIQGCTSNEEGA